MYDVPLSSSTTALPDGTPETVDDTPVVCVPTMKESKSTLHLVGEETGQVGIMLVLVTLAYCGTVSPIICLLNEEYSTSIIHTN